MSKLSPEIIEQIRGISLTVSQTGQPLAPSPDPHVHKLEMQVWELAQQVQLLANLIIQIDQD